MDIPKPAICGAENYGHEEVRAVGVREVRDTSRGKAMKEWVYSSCMWEESSH